VVEEPADHFLGDVPVDHPGAQGVPVLVWFQVDWLPVLIADVAAVQPPVQGPAVGVAGDGQLAVEVRAGPREQHRDAARPALQHPLLLLADLEAELLVDGTRASRFILWL
jgi:hypothetical protein